MTAKKPITAREIAIQVMEVLDRDNPELAARLRAGDGLLFQTPPTVEQLIRYMNIAYNHLVRGEYVRAAGVLFPYVDHFKYGPPGG